MQTLDPFLFAVHHHDAYPAAADSSMRIPNGEVGNGADFDWNKPYRMYHGERIPGFPRHPHRGFETITATIDGKGLIAHSDSFGNAALYGEGDNQWMTAGSGVQHSEMFPLLHEDVPNDTNFFQIWLNLPAKNKMVEPAFVMHWAEDIQHANDEDAGYSVTVYAGEFGDAKGLAPPTSSWASDPANEVQIFHISLRANGGKISVPRSALGSDTNRRIYLFRGAETTGVTVDGQKMKKGQFADLDGAADVEIVNADSETADLLLLSGKPIGEPVAQHGPFVMNTREEIMQAFMDYQRTAFGPTDGRPSWPFERDDPVTLSSKGRVRFARQNGEESYPPEKTAAE